MKSFLLWLIIATLTIGVASAANTRLNITMTETVDQNVTYADNFTLAEDQKSCVLTGIINISNPNSETVSDINLTFTNTNNMLTNFTLFDGRFGSQIMGVSPGDNFSIHIVELMQNNFSSYNYTVDCTSVNPPLDITTNYSNSETSINRKVLAGHNWTINQSATNQLDISVTIGNLNVSIEAQNVSWNGTDESFKLQTLTANGDYANVHGNGSSTALWWWEINGGSLPASATSYIMYKVQAPWNVPTSNTYLAIKETLQYSTAYLASNLSLIEVTAVADIDISENKQIISPADNDNNTNATWRVNADITVPFAISYNLTQVSLWITTNLDPSNTSIPVFGPLNKTYYPNSEINQSAPWDSGSWDFNYSDASSNSNRPPIVWMRPYFTILNAQNQIVNSTLTQNGGDYYLKYIYVINGYWLQIDKNITSIGEDQYKINTLVQNVGNAWTPKGLVVTVYDFVPAEFAAWNWSTSYDSTSSVTGAGYNGSAYRWTIGAKMPYNASLGPSTESLANRTWNVSYNVNGSGDYQVSELYIVGLDPRKVDGAGALEGITMISALSSASAEVFYVFIVLFLVIINVVNLVMTRRINNRLNEK